MRRRSHNGLSIASCARTGRPRSRPPTPRPRPNGIIDRSTASRPTARMRTHGGKGAVPSCQPAARMRKHFVREAIGYTDHNADCPSHNRRRFPPLITTLQFYQARLSVLGSDNKRKRVFRDLPSPPTTFATMLKYRMSVAGNQSPRKRKYLKKPPST